MTLMRCSNDLFMETLGHNLRIIIDHRHYVSTQLVHEKTSTGRTNLVVVLGDNITPKAQRTSFPAQVCVLMVKFGAPCYSNDIKCAL